MKRRRVGMSGAILEMRHITKRFPGVIALKDVSIELFKGEILAICGENGAGKSTFCMIIALAQKRYSG